MSVGTVRGGWPYVYRGAIAQVGRMLDFPFHILYLKVKTSLAVKLYFSESDYDAGANYVLVEPPSAAEPHGWEGPVEAGQIWLAGHAGAVAVEVVAFQRRG